MERSVQAHIDQLTSLLDQLTEQLMCEEDVRQRNEIESKIRAIETAINHYRSALALERNLIAH